MSKCSVCGKDKWDINKHTIGDPRQYDKGLKDLVPYCTCNRVGVEPIKPRPKVELKLPQIYMAEMAKILGCLPSDLIPIMDIILDIRDEGRAYQRQMDLELQKKDSVAKLVMKINGSATG